jgi:hypothetical protein
VATHPEGKEAIKVPVDECRSAVVPGAGSALPDYKGLYLEYIIGNEVYGSASGIADYNPVVDLISELG